MNQSKISVRYAKALFLLSQEKNKVERVKADIQTLGKAFEQSVDLEQMLLSPVISNHQKAKVVSLIFEKIFDPSTLSFLQLVIRKNRESLLKDIIRNFLELCYRSQGITRVVFTSAVSIDPAFLDKIRGIIEKELRTRVEISSNVDETLIGGYVLRVGDKQLDASVSGRLDNLHRKLLENNSQQK